MRKFGLWFAAVTLLALVPTVLMPTAAWAQRQGRGGGGFGGNNFFLLTQKSVQDELKLSEEQVKQVTEHIAKQREVRGDLQNLSAEERRQKGQERAKANDATIAGVLKEDQLKRFKQISLQQRGGQALADPEVAQALGLSSEQKERLGEIQKSSQAEMREMFQGGGDRAEAAKKIASLRASTSEKAHGVLTSEQKEKWKAMVGEPFKGEIRQPQFGRGNPPAGAARRTRGADRSAQTTLTRGTFQLASYAPPGENAGAVQTPVANETPIAQLAAADKPDGDQKADGKQDGDKKNATNKKAGKKRHHKHHAKHNGGKAQAGNRGGQSAAGSTAQPQGPWHHVAAAMADGPRRDGRGGESSGGGRGPNPPGDHGPPPHGPRMGGPHGPPPHGPAFGGPGGHPPHGPQFARRGGGGVNPFNRGWGQHGRGGGNGGTPFAHGRGHHGHHHYASRGGRSHHHHGYAGRGHGPHNVAHGRGHHGHHHYASRGGHSHHGHGYAHRGGHGPHHVAHGRGHHGHQGHHHFASRGGHSRHHHGHSGHGHGPQHVAHGHGHHGNAHGHQGHGHEGHGHMASWSHQRGGHQPPHHHGHRGPRGDEDGNRDRR